MGNVDQSGLRICLKAWDRIGRADQSNGESGNHGRKGVCLGTGQNLVIWSDQRRQTVQDGSFPFLLCSSCTGTALCLSLFKISLIVTTGVAQDQLDLTCYHPH